MFRSNRTSHRSRRPTLETLEGRTLLSTTPLLPGPGSLVPGYSHLSFDRVLRAIPAIERQLEHPSTPVPRDGVTPVPVSVDLDRDGLPDTIGVRHSPGGQSDTLQILFAGSILHPPVTREIALDFVARRLLVGDFDGGGNPDIFIMAASGDLSQADAESSDGLLLMGRPDGLFDAYRHMPTSPSFAVADLRTPGVDDIVYANAPVLTTDAAALGGAQVAALADAGPPATDIQCVDLDGNGTRDIVTSAGDGSVEIYAGLGNGKFSTHPIQVADAFAGTGPVHIAFAHLMDSPAAPGANNATPMDMVVASSTRSEIEVFHGLGDGIFLQGQMIQVGLSPSSVKLQDVTKDGIPDLIVTSAGSNSLWIFRGLGDGRFDDTNPLILPTGRHPTTAFVGNFDGAGRNEIVTLDRWSNALTFYRGATDPVARPVEISSGGVGPTAAVVRDVNGDGYDDLIVANRDSGEVTLFYGGPTGLQQGQTIDRPGTHPAALAVGPGLHSSYQIYVLDDGGSQVEILSFAPPTSDGLSTGIDEAPKLESTPEVRLFFQPTSGSTADSVPILLVAQPEGEETSPGGGQAPLRVPALGPAVAKPEKPGVAALAVRATVEAIDPSEPNESLAQRYLLGLDDIPAPALGPAPARPSSLPDLPAESERGAKAVEPVAPGRPEKQPPPLEDVVFDEGNEAPTDREVEAVAVGDVLVGVVLALGLPSAWVEEPGTRLLTRDGGKRDTR